MSLTSPVPEVLVSSRRHFSSSEFGSGFEHPSHLVEGDILSRIRSLLLSRNRHRVPQVPNNSEEDCPRHVVRSLAGHGDVFDFATAKTVAHYTGSRSARTGLPRRQIRQSRPASFMSMDGRVSPTFNSRRAPLRNASSANDLEQLDRNLQVDMTRRDYLSDGASSPSQIQASKQKQKGPWYPRLVLKDKKKPNMLAVRSCMSTNGDDLACFIAGCDHPRLSPLEIAILREQRCHSRANSVDLENLTRSQEIMNRHGAHISLTRRSSLTPIGSPISASVYSLDGQKSLFPKEKEQEEEQESTKSGDENITARRQSRIISAVSPGQGNTPQMSVAMPANNPPDVTNIAEDNIATNHTMLSLPTAIVSGQPLTGIRSSSPQVHKTEIRSSRSISRQELNEGPLIPKNEEPLELVVRAQSSTPIKLAAGAEFPAVERVKGIPAISAPETESDKSSPREYLTQRLESHEKFKPKSASLLSSSSKRSARHALLKPSITTTSPVDTGLPVPPLLTQIDTVIEEATAARIVSPQFGSKVKVHGTAQRDQAGQVAFSLETMDRVKTSPNPNDNISTRSFKGGKEAASEVEEKLRALQRENFIFDQPELVKVRDDREVPNCCSPESVLIVNEKEAQGTDAPNKHMPVYDNVALHEEYWGFTPAVKNVVQAAVKDAVRIAVNRIILPAGNKAETTSRVYRRLMSDSIAEAAEEVDVYLQQESLWEEQKTTADRSAVLKLGKKDHIPISLETSENMHPTSGHSSPIGMEKRPLQTIEKALDENAKEYRRLAKLSRNGASPVFNTVPNRHSSRGRTLEPSRPLQPARERANRTSQNGAGDGLQSKSSVRWLKDLFTGDESYQPLLTEKPSRTRRVRSLTAPANIHSEVSDTSKTPVAQTFTKTINDLELLLNEAISIARQAADREDAGHVPALLGGAAALLKDGRKGFNDNHQSFQTDKNRRDNVDEITSISDAPSVHESLRSLSDSSDSYFSSEGEEEDDGSRVNIADYRTQIIPLPSTARKVEVTASVSNKSLRSPTPHPPSPTRPSSSAVDRTLSMKDKVHKEQSDFQGFESDYVHEPVGHATDAEKRPSRVTPDMNPFLETPGNLISRRRGSTHVSPADMRSRRATTEKSHQKSIVIDDRAIPRTLLGPDPDSLSVISRGEKVNVIRMGNNSWVEANIQDVPSAERRPSRPGHLPDRQEVREYIEEFHHPPIQLRVSSLNLRKQAEIAATMEREHQPSSQHIHIQDSWQNSGHNLTYSSMQTELKHFDVEKRTSRGAAPSTYSHSYDGVSASDALDFETGYGHKKKPTDLPVDSQKNSRGVELRDDPIPNSTQPPASQAMKHPPAHIFSLTGRHHLSLKGEQHKGFSLTRSHKKPKIARDWAPARKRFVASVACVSTALVGLLVGIYAAEVPAIQYYIVDFHHYVILGNVFFYIGLAIPTFLFWPLPLLHGRKPYIMGSMCLAMPLLFPQAVAVSDFRSPYTPVYRVALLLPRSLMGFVLGFANMNFKSTLTDLFGASLQSANPHQEVVDENDVRRHGGGLGVWLGIWTWCTIGSIGLGFMFGAVIINNAPPTWGFYISIIIIAAVLLLNVICPEVRRSAFRRSVAEAKVGNEVSRRLGRGEVKMHMVQSGPKWWGQEFHHGVQLSMKMLRQPGFLVLAFYTAWIYGQIVLIIVLLGSLTSKYYHLKSPLIGASVASVPIGAVLAVPFQKAGLFSRERTHASKSDDDTRDKRPGWSSHFIRRAIFVVCLPFAGLGYTLSSNGPPIPVGLPIFFAALIGFLSNLALAECHGIIMETFDTSDLQPGMTGRPRSSNKDKNSGKRTNYSSFPRVMSAFGITQCFGYLIGACATAVGGVAERNIGQQAATGVMAGILLILSILLLLVLARFREVQIIPDMHKDKMKIYMDARRKSAAVRGDDLADEDLRPTIIGNPTHITRRMCILEMGSMTRWSVIRQKNHLVNQGSYEAKHPNLAVMKEAEERFVRSAVGSVRSVRSVLSRSPSRSKQSLMSDPGPAESHEMTPMAFGKDYDIEQQDLGGHREMLGNDQGVSRSGGRSRNLSRRVTPGSRSSQRRQGKSRINE